MKPGPNYMVLTGFNGFEPVVPVGTWSGGLHDNYMELQNNYMELQNNYMGQQNNYMGQQNNYMGTT